ncbi:DEAD/DEAH box helicase family protein [Longispora sp. K20-0274]|uniref:DEAD/DEAH box helicase n=1 Tax=Longispora sp. K20-0274 TaxID=3088255 RepID=UPI00399BBA3F
MDTFASNPVSQLIVPSGTFFTAAVADGELAVTNNFGSWPAATSDDPPRDERLWARLPAGTAAGDQLAEAAWIRPTTLQRASSGAVLATYKDALSFKENASGSPGLRTPQLGAVHSVLGYWTTKRATPATVVMPTGTGKTETMLALLVAAQLPRLLVLVPSDALREQIAAKFERLGVLQEFGIVSSEALRPVVGRLQHGFSEPEVASAFAECCNVVVATPQSLKACSPNARRELLSRFTHLFVDEAHHVAAPTWSAIRDEFATKSVVQFTATPFREDGKHLQGTIIYAFPLREAQEQRYFSSINYRSVIDFHDVDSALARASVERLRQDLTDGYDHLLMARVKSIPRTLEVKEYYDAIAAEFRPVVINSAMPKEQQREALEQLRSGASRIVICVNMLGEGFDLPTLKIAAVHDPRKSLAVTLQFIGRFARTSAHGNLGEASLFVARTEFGIDPRLRELYAEDSDWNLILRTVTEGEVEEQRAVTEFEDGFTSLPDEVALGSLLLKMSTVVYRTPTNRWDPLNLVSHFGEDNLLTEPIGINQQAGIAWCVVKKHTDVSWGEVRFIEDLTYELYVVYFDAARRLLYVNNSANDGLFEKLVEAVAGTGAERFTGSSVYRVMADIDRLVPTTVGVLDIHDRLRRFSMHVGSDVTASFSQAEAGTKSQTNISGGGRDGEHVNISASVKGRIWSPSKAPSLKHWRDWCDGIGTLLLDDTITIEQVIGQFILPEPLTERPEGVLLAVEWPWELHLHQPGRLRLSFDDKIFEAVYTDLIPNTDITTGAFRFTVKTAAWAVEYEATVESGSLRYRSTVEPEIAAIRARSEMPLSAWLNANGPLLVLDDDRIIANDLIYRPNWDKEPFDRGQLTTLDWTGTNLKIESQTRAKIVESIQHRTIVELKKEAWDVLIDDDGHGEIADIVGLRIDPEGLLVRLVHCKYSKGQAPGHRVEDLYEVCGQAQKSINWRRNHLLPFFQTLANRASLKQRRDGVSPFEVGDAAKLHELHDAARSLRRRIEMVIVQPGLSAAEASTQQLDLLASTQAYLLTTIKAPLSVWCRGLHPVWLTP